MDRDIAWGFQQPMNDITQQKTIDLTRGLFLLRYNSAEDSISPPMVRVYPEHSSARNCQIIAAPDAADSALYSPEGALVVLVTQPARLVMEVTPQFPGGSVAANIKIEPLTAGRVPSRRPASPFIEPPPVNVRDIRILAHVAGIGDVSETADKWIGGPTAPARIEGLSLSWPSIPADLDIKYAVRFARPQQGDGQLVPLGTFAGTRGRSLPLTGISLEMQGQGASHYTLSAEAIFLGAPAMRATGQRISLAGPSGRETLVGIKFAVEEVHAPARAPEAVRTAPVSGPRSSGRVRVFRSKKNTR